MRLRARTSAVRQASPLRALQHDWYGFDLGEEYLMGLQQQVSKCLSNFESSEVLSRIKTSNPNEWGPFTRSLRSKPFFELDNVRVYAAFDFYFYDDASIFLLDWKAGKKPQSENGDSKKQLKTYALYAHKSLGLESDRIWVQAVWLLSDRSWQPFQVSAEELQSIERAIHHEIESERSLSETVFFPDGKQVFVANRDNFVPIPSVGKCTQCKFIEVCKEGTLATKHILRSRSKEV
jgi:hypothetical protein